MAKKQKGSQSAVSQVSSATAPAQSSSTQKTNKSSILRSAFSPSRLQLSLFASVIQGFDSQHLRIHDTNTGRLRSDYKTDSRASITCLDWGHYAFGHGDHPSKPTKKKRKREDESNGLEPDHKHVVVAFGTSESEIQMFSPSEARVVGVLRGGHSQGVRDFKFKGSAEAWSLGGDGKLVVWNLETGRRKRTFPLPATSIMTLLPLETYILCASNVVYLIDPTTSEPPVSFLASNDTVHTIVTSSSSGASIPTAFLAAAENNFYVNVFDVKSGGLTGTLVAGGDVEYITSSVNDGGKGPVVKGSEWMDIVAIVTKEGILELFPAAFRFEIPQTQKESLSLKEIQKKRVHKATAFVKVVRPDKSAQSVPLSAVSFEGNDLILVWIEAGVNPVFERVQWRNNKTGALTIAGTKEITRAKSGSGLVSAAATGIQRLDQTRVDESRTVVANDETTEDTGMMLDTPEIIDISSAEEDSDSDESELPQKKLTNGDSIVDTSMQDAGSEAGSEADGEMVETEEQPSFGDLIRTTAPETIDVTDAFDDSDGKAVAAVGNQNTQLSSGMSLGTVLSQALRTNDLNLLESCLHFHDLNIIRATIERLPPVHATTLLTKLAERLHNRPGRAGSLMVWVQWTLVAHGGYLASKPDVMKQLTALHRVVKERAMSLQPLLTLKGKLDMLDAQMNLRKSMQKRYALDADGEGDDEDAVIYVEGQEESSSEEDLSGKNGPTTTTSKNKGKSSKPTITNGISSHSDEDMDDLPSNPDDNNINSEDETSDSDSNPLLDREASETDDDSGNEFADKVDYDDVDSLDEDEEAEADMEEILRKQARKGKL